MSTTSQSLAASDTTSRPRPLPDVNVQLSRPAYHLGDPVVGTIHISKRNVSDSLGGGENIRGNGNGHTSAVDNNGELGNSRIRNSLDSAVVYVAGFCRIDPRWHNVSEYKKLYGETHPQLEDLQKTYSKRLLSSTGGPDSPVVCFWATNVLDLLSLEERFVKKQSLPKTTHNGHRNGGQNGFSSSKDTSGDNQDQKEVSIPKDGNCLSFTFRVDIPNDLPPSVSSNTCRYFYSVEVLIRSKRQQEKVYKVPFAVHTSVFTPSLITSGAGASFVSSGRVRIGTCLGMAHSGGLPCHLSSTEINQPHGQLSIQSTSLTRPNTRDVQSVRVTTASGRPVCMFVIVGCSPLCPGGRIHLKWDFGHCDDEDWIPCPQVSAAILGEERARYEDGTTKRTRSFVFDTCLERFMDPTSVRQVCHSLLLPIDAPCTMRTDLMEICFTCQVDIIANETDSSGNVKYNNLRLDIPCRVVHSSVDLESENDGLDDADTGSSLPLQDLVSGPDGWPVSKGRDSIIDFPTNDIIPDLQALSLHMHRSNERRRVANR